MHHNHSITNSSFFISNQLHFIIFHPPSLNSIKINICGNMQHAFCLALLHLSNTSTVKQGAHVADKRDYNNIGKVKVLEGGEKGWICTYIWFFGCWRGRGFDKGRI